MSSTVVRYAVVGLGHIAQVAVLPAFAARAELAARGARERRSPEAHAAIEKVQGAARSPTTSTRTAWSRVDAVYIALPNSMHAEYTIRAANAGVHVLCEKPLAVTVEECEKMIDACESGGVKLMTAYRLHFEPATDSRHRADAEAEARRAEVLRFDVLLSSEARQYPSARGAGRRHAVRHRRVLHQRRAQSLRRRANGGICLFGQYGWKTDAEIDETTAAVLRFERDRLATFITSFNAADTGGYSIVGEKGSLKVDPGYEYAEGLSYELTIDGKTIRKTTAKRDQFAAELALLLGLHSPQPPPGAVRPRRSAGRPRRRGAVRVGAAWAPGSPATVPGGVSADARSGDAKACRSKAAARESGVRVRRLRAGLATAI